jgi:amino acid permease
MLPKSSLFVQIVTLVFCFSIAFSYPIHGTVVFKSLTEFFLKKNYFKASADPQLYWTINLIRAIVPLLGIVIVINLANYLDKVLAFVGCIAPIVTVFAPTCIHYKLCAKTRMSKAIDLSIISIAVVLLTFVGPITIYTAMIK